MLTMTVSQPLDSLHWLENLSEYSQTAVQLYLQLEEAFHLQQLILDQVFK